MTMKIYEFSGKASAFDSFYINFFSVNYNSEDGTFSARVSAYTLKGALDFLVRQLGSNLISIYPVYYVRNNKGKSHLRWLKHSSYISTLPVAGRA